MAVLNMQKLTICAMKKDRKKVLESLQALGVLEVQSVEEQEGFEKMNTAAEKAQFDKVVKQTDQALEILNQYAPEKKSLFASFEGKKLVSEEDVENIIAKRNELISITNKIHGLEKKITEARLEISKKQIKMDGLAPWMNMDIPMNTTGTNKTTVLIGSMAGGLTKEAIEELVKNRNDQIENYTIEIVSSDKNQTCLVAVSRKEEADALFDALRAEGFTKTSYVTHRTPANKKKKYEEDIENLNASIEENINKIKGYAEQRNDLYLLSDYFTIRMDKYDILGGLVQSDKTFFITGYILERDAKKTLEYLNQHFNLFVEISDVADDEEAPVVLKNNAFSGSTEGVLESFGLPKKGEMDPTFVMSLFYVFFYGLMLSDAAYGFLIFVACLFVLIKFPRMGESLRKSIRMFMYCGLSTLFWGVMFGGYFGDAATVIAKTFFGKEFVISPVWFEPLKDPMRLLLYSLAFGMVHLYVGLGMKGYMLIRDKKYFDCLCDVVTWFAMLTGLIMMLVQSSIFAAFLGGEVSFPSWFGLTAKILAAVGAIGILLMSGRKNKNPFIRVALGAYDLYGITSWLSDALSYSRLLALGLATGVIAQVINSMASMGGKSVVGVIVFTVVFILGHVMNLAINMLGAYVHTNRLQYVEFFGKFYEGGGRKFTPFKQNTKYVDIKEDIKL